MFARTMPNATTDVQADWFSAEVESLLPDLFGTALRMTRNRADAEDLVADAVASAWLARESLQQRHSFRGWLFRILTNRFLSGRRAAAWRAPVEPLDDEGSGFSLFERLHQPILLWWGNPERRFFDKLLREDLERAIDALAEPFRLVIIMVDVEGWSYQDAAGALGVPVGTIRSRLARGRAALQRSLWEHARDAGLIGDGPGEETPCAH